MTGLDKPESRDPQPLASLLRWLHERGLVALESAGSGTRVTSVPSKEDSEAMTWGWRGTTTLAIPLDEILAAAPMATAPDAEETARLLAQAHGHVREGTP